MGIKLKDMDAVEPMKGGVMLPVGLHTVTIESAEEGESSGGHPQVEVKFYNDLGDIRDWLIFAPPKVEGQPSFAMQKARALLDAVGIISESGDWEFPTEKLQGKSLIIRVGEEPDNRGKTNDDGTPLMRKRVYEYHEVTGAEQPDTRDFSADNAIRKDDDIPF
ncbi:MAG: hypothetical protein EHM90_06340 [Chloroflexi bacterium]|nr:MAG: hypothetical protein EHM90_06340 [Chloroflexota bacterium]